MNTKEFLRHSFYERDLDHKQDSEQNEYRKMKKGSIVESRPKDNRSDSLALAFDHPGLIPTGRKNNHSFNQNNPRAYDDPTHIRPLRSWHFSFKTEAMGFFAEDYV